MDLQQRVALVTGGGCRLGRAIAESIGRSGIGVAVHYHSSSEGAEAAVAAIRESGAQADAFGYDLSLPESPDALVRDVVEKYGRLDILVNSAAVMLRTPFGDVSTDDWDRMMRLNLRAPFFLAQAAAPHLKQARGCIVNIADLAAFESWPAYVPHGMSKAGVVQMTRALARVLAPEVRDNGIAPGVVMLPEGWPAESEERLAATTPLRRLGRPADVLGALHYLLASDFVTGETLIVDGGRHVRK